MLYYIVNYVIEHTTNDARCGEVNIFYTKERINIQLKKWPYNNKE